MKPRNPRSRRIAYGILLAWLLLILVSPMFLSVRASSSTSTLNPSADAEVNTNNPDANYGSNTYYRVGVLSGKKYRVYIKFDLTGIPEGSAIISATLKLHKQSGTDITVNVHKVSGSWSETGITWNNQPSYDSDTAASDSAPNAEGWFEFDVTSVVQAWIDGESNYGFVLENDGATYSIVFDSREASDTSIRPKLVVEYVPPNTVTTTETVTSTETMTETQTVTETSTVTETETVTETTTIANTTETVTQTETVTETTTIPETTVTQTETVTETTTFTVTEQYYSTVTVTYTETANFTTTMPANQTSTEYYSDLANSLVPVIMVVGILVSILSLLLKAAE